MTTPKAYLVGNRTAGIKARTFRDDLREGLLYELDLNLHVRWPSPKYQADPVRFFREIIGVDPWAKQIEVIEAIRDCKRVSVASGHKVSKSHTAAGVALWYYCSYDDARVVMTSTTARQVDQILWRELRMMRARAGLCVECKLENQTRSQIDQIQAPCEHSSLIDGEIGELARTGLKSRDFREVVGFTAREAEAVAGISGRNLLYIVDEASGVSQEIFEAIEGNRAGGARIVLFSNPTRNEGEHYESFHKKKNFYRSIRISSKETPNYIAGHEVIPGLATRDWVDEKELEWGPDSPMFRVRVLGEHALAEDGKIFSIHVIVQAEQRWLETPEAGRLYVGLDPAGETGSGDESVFSVRRGMRAIMFRAYRGLNDEQHKTTLLQLLDEFRLPRETPVVVLDRDGSIGSSLNGTLKSFLETPDGKDKFELVSVRSSDRAHTKPWLYDRQRDELSANLESWFRDGGSIPEDTKLAEELHAPFWVTQVNGKIKVTPKNELRKELGRSPDRYDALALAVWEPLALREEQDRVESQPQSPPDERQSETTMNPYDGLDAWQS